MSSTTEGIATTCPYCGVGCGVRARVSNDALIAVEGDSAHPANQGKLCIKGTNLAATTGTEDRLLTPRIAGAETDWNTALDFVAQRFMDALDEHGPESIAFYLSGQLLTEDYYVANKLMKGFLGGANVDTNSRLCMASAVAAHKRAFGEDVVPCEYADLETAELVILSGSNMAWAHPVAYQRLAAARERQGTRVVVIDPKVTPTCAIADLHLAIEPGSDVALFNALLTYLADSGRVDHEFIAEHSCGWDKTRQHVKTDVVNACVQTGLSEPDLMTFFEWFAETERVVTVFSQGVNQSSQGTDKANAIINCHLATGRIGRSGCGPFSITGQPNAMGGREVGGMANQLAAHMDFNATDVDRVGRFWQAPNMASEPGLKAVDMFAAVADGTIKAIWIMGTNPAVSLPDSNAIRDALSACPTVVVSDCIAATDTNAYADVLLPAQGWGEKDGTVTNSERCLSRQRRLIAPPGEAKSDWWIVCQVAARMGFEEAFDYTTPAQIFDEHARLSAFENNGKRAFDLGHLVNLAATEYDRMVPMQWPKTRPFANNRFSTPDGRARFVAVTPQRPFQQTSAATPLVLNTGRYRDQWHTMTRTGAVTDLFQDAWVPALQIHPHDAAPRNINEGDVVQVENSLGQIRLIADVTTDVKPGSLFAPIHWNDQFSGRANVCQLVESATDPISGQPESKHAAVDCKPVTVRWRMRLVTLEPVEREEFERSGIQFWSRLPGPNAMCFEVAADNLEVMLSLLDATDIVTMQGSDRFRALGRAEDEPKWLLFGSDRYSQLPTWRHLAAQLEVETEDWQRLSSVPPGTLDTSRCICTCFQVTEQAILRGLRAGASSVAELGDALSCGTNCGSCRHELSQLVESFRTDDLAAVV